MKRICTLLIPALAAVPSNANGQEMKFDLVTEVTDYSAGFGSRRESNFEAKFRRGDTTVILGGSYGQRELDGDKFRAARGTATIYQDWTDRLQTHTRVALSGSDPVFANREVAQNVSYKLVPRLMLTAGGRYLRYHGDVDVLAWSLGGSYYLAGAMVSYRYSDYEVERRGGTHGHLASIKVNDPSGKGSTQVWLGSGTMLDEDDGHDAISRGRQVGVSLQRVQPVSGRLALLVRAGRTWYSTDVADYTGTRAAIGLTFATDRKFR